MPDIDLAELERLYEAATKGPWMQGALDMSAILWSDETHRNGYAKQIATTGPKEDWRGGAQQASDAVLIVAMHTAFPRLLEAAREGERLRTLLQELADASDAEDEAVNRAERMGANDSAYEDHELTEAADRAAEAIVRTWEATKAARAALASPKPAQEAKDVG